MCIYMNSTETKEIIQETCHHIFVNSWKGEKRLICFKMFNTSLSFITDCKITYGIYSHNQ